MKHYQDFLQTDQSFAERIGDPNEFDAAIGQIALGSSFLEDTARNMIMILAGTEFRVGCIIIRRN